MDNLPQLATSLEGRYTLDREIGRGGMATVYLARDVKHDRKVALKVLNPELGAVLGVERFLAEIKVTANLQHPNLLPLFDSGAADGLLFYVMPFVEGESLRVRLDREKQLPVDEAIRIASAIASALDYAHRHGVIHRDLKPENILMHDGQPLIADFGIALAVSNAGGSRITQTGLSLGTPQYMSPEQATGDRVIDGRTDIYSLGAMLYEMLVGDPPHLGSTAQAIVAKVLTEKPRAVRIARPAVPGYVDAAVERALEKLPADRFATAREFSDAISGKFAGASTATPLTADSRGNAGLFRFGRRDLGFAVVIILLVTALAIQATRTGRASDELVFRSLLQQPKTSTFLDGENGTNVAISPNGDNIAYYASSPMAGGTLMFVRPANQIESKPMTMAPTGIRAPVFSPDGKWLAFADGSEIKKVSVDGGPVLTLASIPELPFGLSWGPNGEIVAGSATGGLFLIPERGGTPRVIPKPDGEASNRYPVFLPDGKGIVFGASPAASGATSSLQLAATTLDGKKHVPLQVPGSQAVGYVRGQLLYLTPTGVLMAVAFDASKLKVTGAPVPLLQDVVMDPNGGGKIALSASGTLIYRSGKAEAQAVLVAGSSNSTLTPETHDYSLPRFSPDGRRVAFTVSTAQSIDIWVYARDGNTLTKITSGGTNRRAEWTPDGKRLVFISDRGGSSAIYWQLADGSAPAELLYAPEERDPFECVISPDGKTLVYRTGPGGKPPRSVFAWNMEAKGKSIPIMVSTSAMSYIQMPRISPDGHWIAYQSNESGTFEIYVRPFPGSGGKTQVSIGGGLEPLWSPSGKQLFYRKGSNVMSAPVTPGATLGLGERKVVLTGDFLTNPSHPNYDVSHDGNSLLMLRRAGDDAQMIVVQNWVKEMLAKTAVAK